MVSGNFGGQIRLPQGGRGLHTAHPGDIDCRSLRPFAQGTLAADDSYQSDTINHPDMGEGEKITRAGVRGVATGAASWAGATYGAQLGATIGAAGGPVGIVVGGVVGGIVGGFVARKAGGVLADVANDYVVSPVAKWFGG